MIVILREEDYDAWLDSPAERSMAFIRPGAPTELIPLDGPSPEQEQLFED